VHVHYESRGRSDAQRFPDRTASRSMTVSVIGAGGLDTMPHPPQ
jgi:hypothetical protein